MMLATISIFLGVMKEIGQKTAPGMPEIKAAQSSASDLVPDPGDNPKAGDQVSEPISSQWHG
jgi:hypothetical protein